MVNILSMMIVNCLSTKVDVFIPNALARLIAFVSRLWFLAHKPGRASVDEAHHLQVSVPVWSRCMILPNSVTYCDSKATFCNQVVFQCI
jgi:hypothetical protein